MNNTQKAPCRKVKMLISKAKFFALSAVVPLLVFFLVWSRPFANSPQFKIRNLTIVVNSGSKFLPLVDITPALTGEDAQIFQKTFNPGNKVNTIFFYILL
jgi:hypothetical protein